MATGRIPKQHLSKTAFPRSRTHEPQTLFTFSLTFVALGRRNNKSKKGKGKAVPLQAWNGPEGPRKLWFPDFLTTAQDGGKVVSLTNWPHLPPGNIPGTHFC
jgi:hypothetical protein